MKTLAGAAMLVMVLGGCGGDDPVETVDGGLPILPIGAEDGFSYHVPLFQVPAGMETQDCYFVEVPDLNDGEDILVNRIQVGVREGSHHTNVFRVKTIVNLDGEPGDVINGGECWKAPNWADWPLVANSQQSNPESPVFDWQLPENVVHKFSPHEKLMVQTHYVNASTQDSPQGGEVIANFYEAKGIAEPIEMGTLFATQQSIRICQSDPEPTYHGTCAFPAGANIHIAAANGHFHSRGTKFEVFGWDGTSIEHPAAGEKFYTSDTWDDPPMTMGIDKVVADGGGIWWDCDYRWSEPSVGCDVLNEADPEADDCCYTFGGKVEQNEHCNVFLYYWPKVERTDIFCN